jgi:hypothetical protein
MMPCYRGLGKIQEDEFANSIKMPFTGLLSLVVRAWFSDSGFNLDFDRYFNVAHGSVLLRE